MLTDKIMKSNRAPRVFVSVSMIAIVAFGAYNWAISPQTSYLHAAQQYEKMMRNAGEKTEVIKEQIQLKKVELTKLRKEFDETESGFFTLRGAKEFFSDLEPISLQCKCTIDSYNYRPAQYISSDTEGGGHSSIIVKQVEISLTGRYENIIKFFTRLGGYSERIYISELYLE